LKKEREREIELNKIGINEKVLDTKPEIENNKIINGSSYIRRKSYTPAKIMSSNNDLLGQSSLKIDKVDPEFYNDNKNGIYRYEDMQIMNQMSVFKEKRNGHLNKRNNSSVFENDPKLEIKFGKRVYY